MDRLLEAIQSQQEHLVNCESVSGEFPTVLGGLCDLIIEQQKQIDKLKNDIAVKPTYDQLQFEMTQKNHEIAKLQDKIGEIQVKIEMLDVDQDIEMSPSSNQAPNQGMPLNRNSRSIEIFRDIEMQVDKQLRAYYLTNSTKEQKSQEEVDYLREKCRLLEERIEKQEKIIETFDMSQIEQLFVTVAQVNQHVNEAQEDILITKDSIQRIFEEKATEEERFQQNIDGELHALRRRTSELEEKFSISPELEEMLIDGDTVGLTPLLRAVARDTRRIDFFDKQVSAIRIECENVSSSMKSALHTIQQFNHRIYDFSLELSKQNSHFQTEADNIKSVVSFLGREVSDLLTDLTKLCDAHCHVSSTSAVGLDAIVHLLSAMTGRNFNNVHSLDDVSLEANQILSDLSTKRVNLDMSKQLNVMYGGAKLEDSMKDIKELDVPEYKSEIKPVKVSYVVSSSTAQNIYSKRNQTTESDPLVMISLEEIRVQIDNFQHELKLMKQAVDQSLEEMRQLIQSKMDTKSVDRIISKMQSTMTKCQTGVEEVNKKVHEINTHQQHCSYQEPSQQFSSSLCISCGRSGEEPAFTASTSRRPKPTFKTTDSAFPKRPQTANPKSSLSNSKANSVNGKISDFMSYEERTGGKKHNTNPIPPICKPSAMESMRLATDFVSPHIY